MAEDEGIYLGPRKRRRRQRRGPYRLLLWLLPTVACVVFGSLIVALLNVPGVVFRLPRPSAPEKTPAPPAPSLPAPSPAPETASSETVAPSDSELTVLPPLAAKQRGRRLPRLLLVGQPPDLFANLDAALEIAIPGDVIEVRTNRPMLSNGRVIESGDNASPNPLVIRGGQGFQPIVRSTVETPVITSRGVDLHLENLHFATPRQVGHAFIVRTDSSVLVRNCSLTDVVGDHPQHRSLVDFQARSPQPDKVARIQIDNCFVRGNFVICACAPGPSHVSFNNCLGADLYSVLGRTIGAWHPDWPPDARWKIEVFNSTFYRVRPFLGFGFESAQPNVPRERLLVDIQRTAVGMGSHAFDFSTALPSPDQWTGYASGGGISWRLQQALFDDMAIFFVASTDVRLEGEERKILIGRDLAAFRNFFRLDPGATAFQGRFDPAETFPQTAAVALPREFVIRSVAGARPQDLRGLGCDVSKLPIPPPATMQSYTLPGSP